MQFSTSPDESSDISSERAFCAKSPRARQFRERGRSSCALRSPAEPTRSRGGLVPLSQVLPLRRSGDVLVL